MFDSSSSTCFVDFDLQSKKTALVTGANKGIGKEIVRQLAAKGYQVFLGARDVERGQKAVDDLHALGHTDVHLLVIDVTSDDSVAQAATTLASKITALDVLVNNAGIMPAGFKTPFVESIAEVKETYEVNVFGVIRVTNAFVELVKKSQHGRIVNLSSVLASLAVSTDKNNQYSKIHALSYNSSKSAVNHLTVIYAKALEEFGIKVNSADPGYTATDLNGNSGPQSVEVGAQSSIFLATLPDDGPTASYYDKDGVLPW